MKLTFYILTLVFFLTACKISLSDKDLTAYNVYNINDTLTFKNELGEIKKYSIISKTIINKSWDANTGWYNPQVAYVKYKDFSKPDSIYYDNSFLTIYQRAKNEIEETIYFNGFIGTIDRNNQKTKDSDLLNFEIIFKVPSFDMTTVRDSTEITYIYWSDEFGIVAYDLKNGDKWKLGEK